MLAFMLAKLSGSTRLHMVRNKEGGVCVYVRAHGGVHKHMLSFWPHLSFFIQSSRIQSWGFTLV